jgi:hypothetical protein
VLEGWLNQDGTEQAIVLARFASPRGAQEAFADQGGFFLNQPKPDVQVFDSTLGAVGIAIPIEGKQIFASVQFVCHVGDFMIDAQEYTVKSPNPTAAKALLLRQYEAIETAH